MRQSSLCTPESSIVLSLSASFSQCWVSIRELQRACIQAPVSSRNSPDGPHSPSSTWNCFLLKKNYNLCAFCGGDSSRGPKEAGGEDQSHRKVSSSGNPKHLLSLRCQHSPSPDSATQELQFELSKTKTDRWLNYSDYFCKETITPNYRQG